MTHLDDIREANHEYSSSFGDKAELSHAPQRNIAVLTCMDTRLEPDSLMGLELGQANFIRNAGGRASNDAIRSLVVAYKLLGVTEFYVVHHTDCGMASVTGEQIADLLADSLSPAVRVDGELKNYGEERGSVEGRYIDWLTIGSEPRALINDVLRIRNHPLIPAEIPIYGLIFDVKTGELIEVPEAMAAGQPR